MGLGTFMLSLMVVILITGVQSADVALGDACAAGTDTCTDTGSTCTSGTCLLKVDQTCTGKTDKCVTGADCTGNSDTTCACKTGYTENTVSKLCKKNLGGACEQDTECSDGTKTFCDQVAKKCLLKPEQSCADNTDKCSSGAACTSNKCKCDTALTTAGTDKCTPNANKVGGSCTGTCDDSNAECTRKVCVCKTNFSVNKQSLTCDVNMGETCTASDTCVPGAACSSGKCLLKVGEICTGNKDKCVTGAACTGDSNTKCECGTGYTENTASKLCKRPLGGVCKQYTDCLNGNTMLCDEVTKTCLLKTKQDCKDNTDKCSSGAECTSDTCTCNKDVATDAGTKCTPKANKVGGPCTDTCDDTNAQCTGSVCVCKKNFSVNKQSLTCSSKAGAVVASMTLMLVATLTGLFTRL